MRVWWSYGDRDGVLFGYLGDDTVVQDITATKVVIDGVDVVEISISGVGTSLT